MKHSLNVIDTYETLKRAIKFLTVDYKQKVVETYCTPLVNNITSISTGCLFGGLIVMGICGK